MFIDALFSYIESICSCWQTVYRHPHPTNPTTGYHIYQEYSYSPRVNRLSYLRVCFSIDCTHHFRKWQGRRGLEHASMNRVHHILCLLHLHCSSNSSSLSWKTESGIQHTVHAQDELPISCMYAYIYYTYCFFHSADEIIAFMWCYKHIICYACAFITSKHTANTTTEKYTHMHCLLIFECFI